MPWTWSGKTNFSLSVPVFPASVVFDALAVPPGFATGTANILAIIASAWDPSQTFQISHAVGQPRSPEYSAVPSIGLEASGSYSGLDGVAILPAQTTTSFGGVRAVFIPETDPSVGLGRSFLPGALNLGLPIRIRASTDVAAVTADFCLTAAIFSGTGTLSFSNFLKFATLSPSGSPAVFAPAGVHSGSIITSPPPTGQTNLAFVGWGAEPDNQDVVAPSVPNFALDSNWSNLQVSTNGRLWAGLGNLITLGPGLTNTFSLFNPSAFYIATAIYQLCADGGAAPTSRAARSFAQVIG